MSTFTESKEVYLKRAEFAGRMLGHKLNGNSLGLLLGFMEAIKEDLVAEYMIVLCPDKICRESAAADESVA